MSAITNHPSFQQPITEKSVWRYMDLARYLDIAVRGRLFLSRQDKFRDTFEGALPRVNRDALALQSKELRKESSPAVSMEDQILSFLRKNREETFISCWHLNAGESAAMWDLYGRDGYAIAFRTTYAKLREELPAYAFLGCVKYLDFDTEAFDIGNAFNPSMHKRRSFHHEAEVRAVISGLDNKDAHFNSKEDFNKVHEVNDFGLSVPFNINTAIEEVYLSPDAKPWFVRLVAESNERLGVEVPIVKSSLYDNATFERSSPNGI